MKKSRGIEVREGITVAEAARRLGVSQRQVRNLAAHGRLRRAHTDLIDARSLTLLQAQPRLHGRAWDQPTAWAAIAILTGHPAPWMGSSQRSRLKRSLKQMTAQEVTARSRNRATTHRYRGIDAVLRRTATEIIDTGAAATRLGLAGTHRIEGYLAADQLDDLVRRHRLHPDLDGALTLHATTFGLDTVHTLATDDIVLTALDLADSPDTRERTAGLNALTEALNRLHG